MKSTLLHGEVALTWLQSFYSLEVGADMHLFEKSRNNMVTNVYIVSLSGRAHFTDWYDTNTV
jgi:hypothetical protein